MSFLDHFQVEPKSTIPTRESFQKWKEATEQTADEQASRQTEQGKKELSFYQESTVPLTKKIAKKFRNRNPYKFTLKVQLLFCEHLSILGRVTHAARASGISPLTVKAAEKNDPNFAEMVGLAQMEYRDKVAAEVYRRAIEGWDVPIIGGQWKDQVVAHERRYSDRLLEMEAKRVDSGYREKQALNIGQAGGVIVINASPSEKEPWRAKYNQVDSGPVIALASSVPEGEEEGET
jgi:hypothetical protein